MAVATRTRLQLVQAVADRLGLRRTGTLTAAAAAALTSASYPWKTVRTDAPSREVEGAEIYITSGAAVAAPNPNGIALYAPATGVFTPAVDYSTPPSSTATFDIYGRGVLVSDLQDAVNRALRKIHYECLVPLSLLRDADMTDTGTTNWFSGGTVSKVAMAEEDHLPGSQKLRTVTAGAGSALLSNVTIPGSAEARSYEVGVFIRANAGIGVTVSLNQASAPNSLTVASNAWTYLRFQATYPATSYASETTLAVAHAAAGTSELWGTSIVPVRADMLPAPEWVTDPDQVRQVYTLVTDTDPRSMKFIPARWWDTVTAPLHGVWPLWVSYAEEEDGLPWARVTRPWPELTSDSATTQAPRDLIELAASYEVLEHLSNRAASMEINKWARETMPRFRANLLHLSRRMGSDTVIKIDYGRPFGGR